MKRYYVCVRFTKRCAAVWLYPQRSEISYLREAVEGGTVAPAPRLSVINANGETDICSHCLRRNTDAMHGNVYGSM